jgi:hypothetical protein
MDRRRACLSISTGSTAPTSNPEAGPAPGLPRWVHRLLPPPSLRCAPRALRSGGGSLLWTTGTIRNAVARIGRQATRQHLSTDSGSHRHTALLIAGLNATRADRMRGRGVRAPRVGQVAEALPAVVVAAPAGLSPAGAGVCSGMAATGPSSRLEPRGTGTSSIAQSRRRAMVVLAMSRAEIDRRRRSLAALAP